MEKPSAKSKKEAKDEKLKDQKLEEQVNFRQYSPVKIIAF